MEDHVRGLLAAFAPAAAAALSLATLLQALKPGPASVEWGLLALLLGALAAALRPAALRPGLPRLLATLAAVTGSLVALLLFGEAVWIAARAFLWAGPARSF